MELEGAAALVTGGAGGLGEATVRRLVATGARVVIADLAADKGEALAAELGPAVAFVETDVTSEDSVSSGARPGRRARAGPGGCGRARRVRRRWSDPPVGRDAARSR